MRQQSRGRRIPTSVAAVLCAAALWLTSVAVPSDPARADDTRVHAGQVLQISVPDAIGGKTVVGQLTVDSATARGFVTAYGCADGLPLDAGGAIDKSDLNYDGTVSSVWSNRLVVQADSNGDVCLYSSASVDMVIDVNGVSFDTGITSFPNRRTDTRTAMNTGQLRIPVGGVLRVGVPEAVGAQTVVGQLTADGVRDAGFVTAYGCDFGAPTAADGYSKSDLNFDGTVSEFRSNRLIVQADDDGDICFYASRSVELIVDVNGVTDSGIASFPNRRTDTRRSGAAPLRAGETLRIDVPESLGAKTVLGQLTVDNAQTRGFVTAYGCDDGLPSDEPGGGVVTKSDLNYDGTVSPVWSNRLVVQADADGEICLFSSGAVDIVVDLNGVADDIGIFSFPNQRTDTRSGSVGPQTSVPANASGTPVWPTYTPTSVVTSVAALTGEPVDEATSNRPILAVKIDNFRRARPHFGLDDADAIIEENVEGVTRFVALFQTNLPTTVGPIRSARTSDLDVLSGMNRPVFAYSGANPGVTTWIRSAQSSGVLVDFSALSSPCYRRQAGRPAPHNLVIDATCAVATATARSAAPGQAGALWAIDGAWAPPPNVGGVPDSTFAVAMDGVAVSWTWNPVMGRYVRSQDGAPHLAASGAPITARNVVEVVSTHIPSPVDARSPHPITVGDGAAIIHRAGVAIAGTWSRTNAFQPFVFRDATTGAVVPLDTGRTFIQLVRPPS